MKQVFKYAVPIDGPLELPVGAEVLTVATQAGAPHLWALIDTTEGFTELRSFMAVPTGAKFDPEGLRYLGSCHAVEGWMVFHVYERTVA